MAIISMIMISIVKSNFCTSRSLFFLLYVLIKSITYMAFGFQPFLSDNVALSSIIAYRSFASELISKISFFFKKDHRYFYKFILFHLSSENDKIYSCLSPNKKKTLEINLTSCNLASNSKDIAYFIFF